MSQKSKKPASKKEIAAKVETFYRKENFDKVLFIDTEPELKDVYEKIDTLVYVLRTDGLFDVWMHDEGQELWSSPFVGQKMDSSAATGHYSALRWKLFNKATQKERKDRLDQSDRESLRRLVRYFYDLQKLRCQAGNRDTDQAEPAVLDEEDKTFLGSHAMALNMLEQNALKEVEHLIRHIPIYKLWLVDQKGFGPTMSGVLISEIDITKCNTVSALWAYAGLSVDNQSGRAVRRQKGVKSNWNPFLKAKVVFVMAGCLIKCNSPWRKHYDDYKMRKQNQLVPVCMGCEGKGKVKDVDDETKTVTCSNCGGKPGPAPWGRSNAHRDLAAKRYMMKQFLMALWLKWRELEGLPITDPYAKVALGREHGDHGGHGKAQMNQRTGKPYQPTGHAP